MSDLSRLRARWVRLEQRIAKLNAQLADDGDAAENEEIETKLLDAIAKLKLTIEQTGVEERRLVAADAKLRYTNV